MKKLASTILVLWSALVCAAFAPLYVPAINVVSAGNPCSSLDSSTTALVARMTVDPGCPRKIVINDLIVSLKTAGVWSKLDALYLFAAADSQAALLNWVSTSYNATATNSPTFTTDRGFTGNGSNSYISSNFNPTTASSPNFVQNSAHMSGWSRTSTGLPTADDLGGATAGQMYLRIRSIVDVGNATVNSVGNVSVSSSDGTGHFVANRNSSTVIGIIRNGTSLGSTTAASLEPFNQTLVFLRNASNYSSRQFAAGSIGAGLSPTELTDFYNALQTYMTAVGA